MKHISLPLTCASALILATAPIHAETLVFDQPECAGMSGFRAHWDQPIPVVENGARVQVDSVVKDKCKVTDAFTDEVVATNADTFEVDLKLGETSVWKTEASAKPGGTEI